MMVMTAKVDLKKILLVIAAVAAVIFGAILLLDSEEADTPTAVTVSASANDGRIQFLKSFGWEVTTSPIQSGQVKIPKETSDVFDRYNRLQMGQGYDLSAYAGKPVMRYVYEITNFPGATAPVYATVLVYKDQVIGGDVTDTAAKGKIRGFRMPEAETQPTTSKTAAATSEAAAS